MESLASSCSESLCFCLETPNSLSDPHCSGACFGHGARNALPKPRVYMPRGAEMRMRMGVRMHCQYGRAGLLWFLFRACGPRCSVRTGLFWRLLWHVK